MADDRAENEVTDVDLGKEPPGEQPQAASARQHVWTMASIAPSRNYADDVRRLAAGVGAGAARLVRRAATVCAAVGVCLWRLISDVPAPLRLLGALGLTTGACILGSVVLDNALGTICAVVFVPVLAAAFAVVAHRHYQGLAHELGPTERNGVGVRGEQGDLERSVAYVDSKLAFALEAFGTDRHQQAVVAIIQAKTATELAYRSTAGPLRPAQRPRIQDGAAAKASRPSVAVGS